MVSPCFSITYSVRFSDFYFALLFTSIALRPLPHNNKINKYKSSLVQPSPNQKRKWGYKAVMRGEYLGSPCCLSKSTQFKLSKRGVRFRRKVSRKVGGNVRSLLKGILHQVLFFSRSSSLRLCPYHSLKNK